MRPVLLDMDGFASFRDQATVDFTDADYFALVGPTGSGKSTGTYGLLAWLTATTIAGVMPEIGVTAALSAGTVAAAVLLGTAAVAAAAVLTLRKLRRTDIPATLRVVE